MESFEHFHLNRSVFEDFTSRTLAFIPNDFGRLYYVSSLMDDTTGQYVHEGLSQLYPINSVQSGLAQCHEELFSRILETPLRDQARDLRKCLETAGDQFSGVVEGWREGQYYKLLCPQGLPDYLNQLFCSNMRAMLEIFSSTQTN